HGIQRVQDQAQHTQRGAHGNADADQDQQQDQGSGNHDLPPSTIFSPASASSEASSWVLRMPHSVLMVSMSPVTSATEERSSISARTMHSQIRPATHRN